MGFVPTVRASCLRSTAARRRTAPCSELPPVPSARICKKQRSGNGCQHRPINLAQDQSTQRASTPPPHLTAVPGRERYTPLEHACTATGHGRGGRSHPGCSAREPNRSSRCSALIALCVLMPCQDAIVASLLACLLSSWLYLVVFGRDPFGSRICHGAGTRPDPFGARILQRGRDTPLHNDGRQRPFFCCNRRDTEKPTPASWAGDLRSQNLGVGGAGAWVPRRNRAGGRLFERLHHVVRRL